MHLGLCLYIALFSVIFPSPLYAQLIEYAHDDGTGNFTIGPSSFDANMTWLNTFTAQPDGEVIVCIDVAFGGITGSNGLDGPKNITLAILNDPNNDGDPADAQLLATYNDGLWEDLDSNEFQSFCYLPPVEVTGTFFVAVEMDVLEGANPARMDPQGPGSGTESWLFFNPESRLDNLGSSEYTLRMSDSPFQGAWMIRARAGGRGCLAERLIDGVLNYYDVLIFQEEFLTGSPQVDFINDGVLDIFDVFEFFELYNSGCPEP